MQKDERVFWKVIGGLGLCLLVILGGVAFDINHSLGAALLLLSLWWTLYHMAKLICPSCIGKEK